jgi:hypothetical protein
MQELESLEEMLSFTQTVSTNVVPTSNIMPTSNMIPTTSNIIATTSNVEFDLSHFGIVDVPNNHHDKSYGFAKNSLTTPSQHQQLQHNHNHLQQQQLQLQHPGVISVPPNVVCDSVDLILQEVAGIPFDPSHIQ